MSRGLTGSSIVVAEKDIVSCALAEGSALLDLRASTYYSLNSVGSWVWTLVQEPKSVAEILDQVLQHYEVDPARCREDLETLLRQLADARLIKVDDPAPH